MASVGIQVGTSDFKKNVFSHVSFGSLGPQSVSVWVALKPA